MKIIYNDLRDQITSCDKCLFQLKDQCNHKNGQNKKVTKVISNWCPLFVKTFKGDSYVEKIRS